MKTSKILLSTFVLGAVALSVPALAEPHEGGKGHHGGKFFEKMDTDGDGKISLEEHLEGSKARFAKMDADGDGYVTKEEAKKLKEKMHGMRDKFKAKMQENSVE